MTHVETELSDAERQAGVLRRAHSMQVVKQLALRFIERAEALNYKGKKRDDAALDFFCGAACVIEANGDPDLADHIGRVAVMLISVRGYFAVRELAARN